MPLWETLRQELASAGRAAQGAIDEGKIRLEAFRARQLADKAAQALGYAVHRARAEARELDPDVLARLSSAITTHEAEVARHEARMEESARSRGARGTADRSSPGDSTLPPQTNAPPPDAASPGTSPGA